MRFGRVPPRLFTLLCIDCVFDKEALRPPFFSRWKSLALAREDNPSFFFETRFMILRPFQMLLPPERVDVPSSSPSSGSRQSFCCKASSCRAEISAFSFPGIDDYTNSRSASDPPLPPLNTLLIPRFELPSPLPPLSEQHKFSSLRRAAEVGSP